MDDAALWRHLDGADVGDERAAASRHLAACEACRSRFADLRRRGQAFSRILLQADPVLPPLTLRAPRRPARRAALAAAVAAALGVALVGAVDPLRAWIVERSADVWAFVTGGAGPAPPPAADRDSPAATTASITFRPAGTDLFIRIAARQRRGGVTIVAEEVDEVTAMVLDGTEREAMQLLPGGVRVHNDTASTARYRFTVPSYLAAIYVDVAGTRVLQLTPADSAATWTIDLARP